MPKQAVLDRLEAERVVPVVRVGEAELALLASDWLIAAGFNSVEISLSMPGAISVIRHLAEVGRLVVGAGTVLSREDALACIDAGARFVVSPCIVPEVAEACGARDVPCLLGALTPTELRLAVAAGADAVKIFPVGSLGGPSYIRSLKSVFPGVRLVPTGGVNAGTVGDYLAAGASFVGVGGKLVGEAAVRGGNRDLVVSAGREVLAAARVRR